MGLFNTNRIDSLEQSVATLTEGLEKTKSSVDTLYTNLTEIVNKVNELTDSSNKTNENIESMNHENASSFKNMEESIITLKDNFGKEIEEYTCSLEEKIKTSIDALEKKSDKADDKHNEEIKSLKQSIDALVKECEELQNNNKELVKQHEEIIARYEESIKGYQEQTEHMKNNILKKMNMDNVFTVKEG